MMMFIEWLKSFFKKQEPAKVIPLPIENVAPVKIEPVIPWMVLAKKEIGISEVAGDKDNPRITEYHKATTLKATHDEVPWCSSFINFIFFCLGWKRTKSAGAISWLEWGIKLKRPRYGAVCVKERKGGNHVTFFVRYEMRNGIEGFIGLGGNQGNRVCEAWYPLASVKGWMWPEEARHLLKDGEAA
jgi:uncharacterized protein (TIGR02594 family)